ncbi:flagellar hook-length control protein FliK [Paenibacillus taihuensis]|uniref:Flagellar hook-length control protein FliK n=1 Tax=Paenibacillus taihuensis TaxID=1156355 RepID=A0A3D9SEV9_9BACL|nr:flagellar hook-length control protein FliK [Paenibacillus taihuensis]REE94419.1 flagellar hook-length control protein FliK [Paenibacillus taihuensis]
MQMSVSNAPANAAPAGSSAASAPAKGGDNAGFVQTLAQTIAGTPAANTGGEANGDAIALPKTANLLASLLVSKDDLLAAIDGLLKQLSDTDDNQLAAATTKDNLSDALAQLDDLMSLLAGMPTIAPQLPDTQGELSNVLPADWDTDQTGTESAMLDLVTALSATGTQAAAAQTTAGQAATDADVKSVNIEEIAALKSGLQDALSDLRTLLQQTKNGGSAGRNQNALISKQLIATEQLINGSKPDLQEAIQALKESSGSEQVDSIRSVQTATVTTSSHLQRMAHQLLHVGLMKVVPKNEEQTARTAQTDSEEQLNVLSAPIAGAMNQDLQRAQQVTQKQVIAQPVPVNQFASTIQGLVVKQFQVHSGNGLSQAQLTLYPEHLGQVNVNISVHGGIVTAQFLADTVTAKDMLENQMAQLRSTLQSQGLQVDKLEVSQTAAQTSLFQEHERQGHSGREQGGSGRGGSSKKTDLDFNADLEEIELEQAVDRDLGLGRGIHTTA